ncbi:hypothetical protein MHYP_G00140340 [Metynnis hypsauchen]
MHAAEVALSVLLAAIIVVSLLANVLVLVCFVYNAEIRRQVPGLFVLNLTCCNLLLASSNMPLTVAGLLGHAPPPGGHVLCQLAAFVDTFLTSNSMLSMAALSIDRWVAVVFPAQLPLAHAPARRRARARLRVAPLAGLRRGARVPLVARLPPADGLVHAVQPGGARLLARSLRRLHRGAARAHLPARARGAVRHVPQGAASGALPLQAHRRHHHADARAARGHPPQVRLDGLGLVGGRPGGCSGQDPHGPSQSSVRQRCLEEQRKRRQRATRKISTFIGTFVICFTPYVLTRVVELFVAVPISPYWGVLCKSLAYSKAACDPFVYSLLRHQYRQTCRDIINRFLKRRSLNTSGQRQENGKVKKPVNSGKSEISEKPEKSDKERKTGTGSAV